MFLQSSRPPRLPQHQHSRQEEDTGSTGTRKQPEEAPVPELLSKEAASWVAWALDNITRGDTKSAKEMLIKGLKIQREITGGQSWRAQSNSRASKSLPQSICVRLGSVGRRAHLLNHGLGKPQGLSTGDLGRSRRKIRFKHMAKIAAHAVAEH